MRAISERFAADAAPAAPNSPRVPYPGLAAALARDLTARAKAAIRAKFHAGALARLGLGGPLPAHLAMTPDALAPATLEGAQDILRGVFTLGAGQLTVRGRSPFDAEADDALRAELHRFEWLAHLEKAGGRTAEGVARALTEDWLDRFERFHAFAWRGDVLGPRVVAWAAHFRFLTADHDLLFRSRLMKAMAEQTRHLARSVEMTPAGPARLDAAAALTVMALAMPEAVKRPERAFAALAAAIAGAFTSDGGIVTRSPQDQAGAVAALVRVRRALSDARAGEPPFFGGALSAAEARLTMLRLGDGGLACFHGASEGDRARLNELTEATRAQGPGFASEMGYARLTGGEGVAIFDCGGPPAGAFAITAHATLQIADADAGAILGGAAARRLGQRLYGGTARGVADFSTEGCWAEGHHDLWMASFGAIHRRRLYLDPTGTDLRGEDTLTRARPRGALELTVRFPLHPDCKATLAQGGDSIIVAPPGGPTWRFRAALEGPDERLELEDAVYMGGETVRRSQAIVIRALMTGTDWTLRWALKTESAAHRPRRRLV